jgi:hypothetical protein
MHDGGGGGSHVLVIAEHTRPLAHSPGTVVTHPLPCGTFALQVDGVVVVSQYAFP